MLAVPLNPEIEGALAPLAEERHQSIVDYAQDVLLEHISEAQSIRIAEERWERYLKGEEAAIPLADVAKRYAVED